MTLGLKLAGYSTQWSDIEHNILACLRKLHMKKFPRILVETRSGSDNTTFVIRSRSSFAVSPHMKTYALMTKLTKYEFRNCICSATHCGHSSHW